MSWAFPNARCFSSSAAFLDGFSVIPSLCLLAAAFWVGNYCWNNEDRRTSRREIIMFGKLLGNYWRWQTSWRWLALKIPIKGFAYFRKFRFPCFKCSVTQQFKILPNVLHNWKAIDWIYFIQNPRSKWVSALNSTKIETTNRSNLIIGNARNQTYRSSVWWSWRVGRLQPSRRGIYFRAKWRCWNLSNFESLKNGPLDTYLWDNFWWYSQIHSVFP